MKLNNDVNTLIIGISFLLLSFPSGAGVTAPAGATGYIGTLKIGNNIYTPGIKDGHYNQVGFSRFTNRCSTAASVDSEQKDVIERVPGLSGVYGFKLTNATNAQSGYILAVPDGYVAVGVVLWDSGGYADTLRAHIVNSKVVSIDSRFREEGPLCFGVENDVDVILDNASIGLDSVNLYAVGNLMPGRYQFPASLNTIVRGASYGPGVPVDDSQYQAVVMGPNDTVDVLNTCDVTPSSPTNIVFNNQLAKNFPTATLVESVPATITFNCNMSGTSGIFLNPRNPLVTTSGTGMSMTPSKSADAVSPYIVTSLDTAARNNALCADNASRALKYFTIQNLSAVTAGTPELITYYFNLCAKGNIKADAYSGSMDVQIIVK